MQQKGFILTPLLVVGIFFLMSSIFLFKSSFNNSNTHLVQKEPVLEQNPTATPIQTPDEKQPATIVPTSPNKISTCDINKNVCFESPKLDVTIQEGYLEDSLNTDKWISDQVVLTGQGSGGYELRIEGFPKEISVRSPVQDFKNGAKQKIYIRVQKDVTTKGTYKGKIFVKSFITGNIQSADLTVTYIGWTDNSIHTDPSKIIQDCTIEHSGEVTNRYINCGPFHPNYIIKFYYRGDHKGIETRTVADKYSKRWVTLTVNDKTTFDVHDTVTLYIGLSGFPENKYLDNEPSGTYTGHILFVDQVSQKELLQIPYSIKITGEK